MEKPALGEHTASTSSAVGGTSSSKSGSGGGSSGSSSGGSSREWGFSAIADMLVGGGSSSRDARFPEKLIKRLNERLQNIAMGKDPLFRDQSLRSTIGVFYGQYQEPTFQRQMRENRKVEDLILRFATAAQASLRKRAAADEWKQELEVQVGQFVRILREALKAVSGVPKELTDRLDSYAAKLTPRPISLAPGGPIAGGGGAAGAAGAASSSSANGAGRNRTPSNSGVPTLSTLPPADQRRHSAASFNAFSDPVSESPLVQALGRLFNVAEQQLRLDVESLKQTCTDKVSPLVPDRCLQCRVRCAGERAHILSQHPPQAAVADLKRCTANINLGHSWPGRREDFASEAAWQSWRSQELSALSSMIAALCKNNPELMKTAVTGVDAIVNGGRRGSATPDTAAAAASSDSPSPAPAAEDDSGAGDDFTYIPPDPLRTYKRALELCIDYDLEQIRSQEDAEEVSLSILSPIHVELLRECAQIWRISSAYRALSNFDVIRHKFEAGEAPLDCLSVAMATVDKTQQEQPPDQWKNSEVREVIAGFRRVGSELNFQLYLCAQTADAHRPSVYGRL